MTEQFAIGQRYIGCGKSEGEIIVSQTPGNALGAYLDGAKITVRCNAQDATGDTMNDGEIVVYGNAGDGTGYAMRGGRIFIRGNSGYRTGIHMKEYQNKIPILVIGGRCGSFLGEYQAGGLILVLGIGYEGTVPVGRFCGTGMHGGRIILRTEHLPRDLPQQVMATRADEAALASIKDLIREYCKKFDTDAQELLTSSFYILEPNSRNPYKQLYVHN